MQHISFYKDRLPFKPKSNVVIYFDVTGIGAKRYYHVLNEYGHRDSFSSQALQTLQALQGFARRSIL